MNSHKPLVWRYLAMPICFAGMLEHQWRPKLNPAAVRLQAAGPIPWSPVDARGAQNAVVVGDRPRTGSCVSPKDKRKHFLAGPHSIPRPLHRRAAGHLLGRLGAQNSIPKRALQPMRRTVLSRLSAQQVQWDGAPDEAAVA